MEEFDRDTGDLAAAMTCRTAIVLAPSRRKFSCKINAAHCKQQYVSTAGEFRVPEQFDTPRASANNNGHQCRLQFRDRGLKKSARTQRDSRSALRIKQESGTLSRPGPIGAIPEFQFPE
jgi:hypothetical protein